MRLIDFLSALLGILFVMRTLHVFRGRTLVGVFTINAIGLTALIGISLIGFFRFDATFARPPLILLITGSAPLALIACERRRLTALRARVPLFVDKWILNLRLGASLTGARARALHDEDPHVQRLLRPVFESGTLERRRHLLLSPAVLREFEQLTRATHAGLERLETLRSHLRDESEFRRKSGQAVRQAAIQSVVMLIMLIALSIFTIHRYGWSRSGDLVTIAATLSLLGTVLMSRLTRKSRWNL